MKVELLIRQGIIETRVVLDGFSPMVEHLLEAIKKAAYEKDKCWMYWTKAEEEGKL